MSVFFVCFSQEKLPHTRHTLPRGLLWWLVHRRACGVSTCRVRSQLDLNGVKCRACFLQQVCDAHHLSFSKKTFKVWSTKEKTGKQRDQKTLEEKCYAFERERVENSVCKQLVVLLNLHGNVVQAQPLHMAHAPLTGLL